MPQRDTSRTAEYAALFRAVHRTEDGAPTIFDDPIARDLLGRRMKVLTRFPSLFRFIERRAPLRPSRGQVLVRACWAEDRLKKAVVEGGLRQYVLLGAGLDSFAVRRPAHAKSLRIFELDQEKTMAEKVKRLRRLPQGAPADVEFIGCDLEAPGAVPGLLEHAGFAPRQPAFFSALGLAHYFPSRWLGEVLTSLLPCAAPGSQLVLDYRLPERALSQADREVNRTVAAEAAAGGEEMASTFTADEVRALAEERGWRFVENLTPDDQRDRYLRERTDRLDVLGMFSLLALEVPGPGSTATTRASSAARMP